MPDDDDGGLVCPDCGCRHFFTIRTTPWKNGKIMRRRECRYCGRRKTTIEEFLGPQHKTPSPPKARSIAPVAPGATKTGRAMDILKDYEDSSGPGFPADPTPSVKPQSYRPPGPTVSEPDDNAPAVTIPIAPPYKFKKKPAKPKRKKKTRPKGRKP